MSNKLYSIAGSMLVLSAFHVSQGMDDAIKHYKKLQLVLNQMVKTQHAPYLRPIRDMEANVQAKFEASLQSEVNGREQLLYDIEGYDFKEYFTEDFNELEAARDKVLEALKQDAKKAQELEKSELLNQAFEELFPADQNQVCEKLLKSIVSMENLAQAEEQSTNTTEVVPVTVGWGTWFKDKIWGASNLVSELTPDKLPLEVLQKSPDMKDRINDMIASYSPSEYGLPLLVDIYTALDQLQYKFVAANVNTKIYHACNKRLIEEEAQYDAIRKAYIFGIAKFLTSELQKMVAAEAPRLKTMEMLEKMKELTRKTGTVEGNEEKAAYMLEPKIFDIICHLEALSEEWLKEENAK